MSSGEKGEEEGEAEVEARDGVAGAEKLKGVDVELISSGGEMGVCRA